MLTTLSMWNLWLSTIQLSGVRVCRGTAKLPWDGLDSDDDTSVSSPAYEPPSHNNQHAPVSDSPLGKVAEHVQPSGDLTSALRPLTESPVHYAANGGLAGSAAHADGMRPFVMGWE